MNPAPYNPATLNRIRQGASASQLGWDEQRYLRVCRAHGIEGGASPIPSVIEPAPAPAQQRKLSEANIARKIARITRQLERDNPKTPEPSAPLIDDGHPHWNFQTQTFSFGHACVAIPGRVQTKILSMLFNSYCIDPNAYIAGNTIVKVSDSIQVTTKGFAFNLSSKLRRVGWYVEGRMGKGGYRLAKVAVKDSGTTTVNVLSAVPAGDRRFVNAEPK